jgi:hypothetical protein
MGNNFFKTTSKPVLFVWQEVDKLRKAVLEEAKDDLFLVASCHGTCAAPSFRPNAIHEAKIQSKYYNTTVHVSEKDDLIFLVRREPFTVVDNELKETYLELWYVIIGEKIGWIVVPDWLELEEL